MAAEDDNAGYHASLQCVLPSAHHLLLANERPELRSRPTHAFCTVLRSLPGLEVISRQRTRDSTPPPQRGSINEQQGRRGSESERNTGHNTRGDRISQLLVHWPREEGKRAREDGADEAVAGLRRGRVSLIRVGEVVATCVSLLSLYSLTTPPHTWRSRPPWRLSRRWPARSNEYAAVQSTHKRTLQLGRRTPPEQQSTVLPRVSPGPSDSEHRLSDTSVPGPRTRRSRVSPPRAWSAAPCPASRCWMCTAQRPEAWTPCRGRLCPS